MSLRVSSISVFQQEHNYLFVVDQILMLAKDILILQSRSQETGKTYITVLACVL